jgi:hypothetical protein
LAKTSEGILICLLEDRRIGKFRRRDVVVSIVARWERVCETWDVLS